MNYRPDIDGLRTIAVVPVVLFHANVAGFTGGFVGVDIFFVISGFLITTIIHRELAEGRFSILRFYERRARRILPALFAVIVASLIAGWFTLAPADYDKMGQSILSALLFVSNMWFWRNSGGYFDGATDYLPMLHTWSLAVEEQFYIFFPLLLMLLHKIGRRLLLPVIVLLVAGSLVVAIWATPRMPSASFYLLPTRIWELGIGSLLALGLLPAAAPKALREGVGALGLVFLYDGSTEFPGLAALPPVLGAAALIWAGTAGPVAASRLLALRPMVWIGLISYSLYLWHWPIMAFLRNRLFTVDLEPTWQVVTVLASVAAGWISWRFIERPFRVPVRAGGMGQGRIFALSGAGMAVLGGLAAVSVVTQGVPQRFSEDEIRLTRSISRFEPAEVCFGVRAAKRTCIFGDPNGKVRWVLWGDSHAKSILPALDTLAARDGIGLMFISAPSCPPIPGAMELNPDPLSKRCAARRHRDLARIEALDSVDTIFLAARWPRYVEGTELPVERSVENATAMFLYDAETGEPHQADVTRNPEVVLARLTALRDRLLKQDRRILLLGTVPEIPWNVADRLKASVLFGAPLPAPVDFREVAERQVKSDAVLSEVAQVENVFYLPLARAMCDTNCPTHTSEAAFYHDNNHLTLEGAQRLVLPILERALSGRHTALDKP
ncbi:O-acetyltransferase OatA (plasmid) [Antarctobacter heliothermus]|uniref:O-acetyltransferase OatA n=1 Tax=Antarctobacter heliothermus TaxID=74033 RepID=A0A222EBW3_9RHOB|nr:acyltransferase family protein [Antarctobacter heliothermus]ASP23590.1 O-acetyltransferase OatA [Antarctobacter heliothermus]